jgi:hypothetical protein
MGGRQRDNAIKIIVQLKNFELVAILTNPILHPNIGFKPFWQEYFLWEWK